MMRRSLAVLIAGVLSAAAYAQFDDCRDQFPGKQVPTVAEAGRDLCFDSFAVLYSPKDKKPIYAVERLNREQLTGDRPVRKEMFYEEARLRASERSTLADYKGSGWDRGHNAPAADMPNDNAMAQSFSLANIMPQASENNRGVWAKDVERATRRFVMRAHGDVYVFTGSVGSQGSIGANRVTVPAYLWKLVYDEAGGRAWVYWLPNSNFAQMNRDSMIAYSELVKRTGINFNIGSPMNR